jgi:hypothetical protein
MQGLGDIDGNHYGHEQDVEAEGPNEHAKAGVQAPQAEMPYLLTRFLVLLEKKRPRSPFTVVGHRPLSHEATSFFFPKPPPQPARPSR